MRPGGGPYDTCLACADGMAGKVHRFPRRGPVVMMMPSRLISTLVALNVTVQPLSIMGARPPSGCWSPGTKYEGTVRLFDI